MVRRSILVWLAAAGACAPEGPEIPPILWVGEHIEYAPQDGAPEPCAGTLPYMDRFVARIAKEMGVELRGSVLYVHGEDAGAVCDEPGNYGCGFDGGVYARTVPLEHELVHGVRRQYGGSMRFIEEGAAEAFGDDTFMHTRVAAAGDVVEGMRAGSGKRDMTMEWYPLAGHFAAYLHEHYGPEVTTALLLRTDRFSSVGTAVAAIEDTTGLPFDEILEDFSTEPTCTQRQYRSPLIPCEQLVDLRIPCDGTVELGSVRIDCGDPSTLGPRHDNEGMFRYLVVEVEQTGTYVITAVDQDRDFVPLNLKECALGCGSILTSHVNADDEPRPAFLRAGRYVLKLWRYDHTDPIDVVVKAQGLACG